MSDKLDDILLKDAKPCPFCGGVKILRVGAPRARMGGKVLDDVFCWECGAMVDEERWNTRPEVTK